MQLMRRNETWNPFRRVEELTYRLNRLFGRTKSLGNGCNELIASADWSPSCDFSETNREYRIRVELPDVKKEDVHVTLDNGILTIQGRRNEGEREGGTGYRRREPFYGDFLRRFTVPEDANQSTIAASLEDGMLDVVISKTKSPETKAAEITVH